MSHHSVLSAAGILFCLFACCKDSYGYSGGSGTAEDPFRISTVSDWLELTAHPADWGRHFLLMEDLDLQGETLAPIGTRSSPFGGFLDGNGHILRNATINQPYRNFVGLFGCCLGAESTICNLRVETIKVVGRNYVGGIAGENFGSIRSCSVSGVVTGSGSDIGGLTGWNSGTIISCHTIGTVTGSEHVGGLIGLNDQGTIHSSSATSSVTGRFHTGGLVGGNIGTIDSAFATGSVFGSAYSVGGLAGGNSGTIRCCYASGNLSGSGSGVGGLVGWNSGTIDRSYATKSVAGSYRIGGLVGETFQGMIAASFWDIESAGLTVSEGGIGKTTAEMKTRSTFTQAGWDFVGESANGIEDVWRMCTDGSEYPRLAWEFARTGDFTCPDGVDVEDLILLVDRWLTADPNRIPEGDATGDSKVGLGDLAVLSRAWLSGNPEFPNHRTAYWAMNDHAPDRVVMDTGGHGYNGTAQRNTETIATEGKIDGALAFDGIGDWIDCGTDAALLPQAWTVCAWVKCEDTATPTLVSFGGTYPALKLQQNEKGRPLMYLGQYNYRYFDASAWTTLKDGQWHHVAFVVPGAEAEDITGAAMYLDGRSVPAGTTRSDGPQAVKTRLLIGINQATGKQRFAGAMDEVMLFDRALTAGEIQRIAFHP